MGKLHKLHFSNKEMETQSFQIEEGPFSLFGLSSQIYRCDRTT